MSITVTTADTQDLSADNASKCQLDDLPVEIIDTIVQYLRQSKVPRIAGTGSRKRASCPCRPRADDHDRAARVQVGDDDPQETEEEEHLIGELPLSMTNKRLRAIVFEEKVDRGLVLQLCDEVLRESEQIALRLRNRIK